MRLLILSNNSDGLYGFRRELLAVLAKSNDIYVSTPNDGYFEELQSLGCTVLETNVDRRGVNPLTDLKLLAAYRRLLRKIKPGLVITYTIKPNIYGGLACRLAGIPYAANVTGLGTAFERSGALRRLVTMLYRAALKRARTVFFENAGNKQTLLSAGVVKPAQCRVLNGAGVNLTHYAATPYPEDETPTRFLFIGRVMQEKGVDELFTAMERLRAEGIACTLDMLGGYEENYADRIQGCEAAGWLKYHGYQKDVRPFIAGCHCFVLPSWHEGMANTNLECAASGRPLITSAIPGCLEAVVPGESGLLCEPKNTDSLYSAMKAFCTLPRPQRAAMGAAGRAHMEAAFDKNKVVEATVEGLSL